MRHAQTRLTASDGRVAEVDKRLAPLIAALWERGYTTLGSCQHEEGTPMAWIAFDASTDEAQRFAAIAHGSLFGPLDPDDDPRADVFTYDRPTMAVAFPHRTIPKVTARVLSVMP